MFCKTKLKRYFVQHVEGRDAVSDAFFDEISFYRYHIQTHQFCGYWSCDHAESLPKMYKNHNRRIHVSLILYKSLDRKRWLYNSIPWSEAKSINIAFASA